jgi:hypothetical protein
LFFMPPLLDNGGLIIRSPQARSQMEQTGHFQRMSEKSERFSRHRARFTSSVSSFGFIFSRYYIRVGYISCFQN